MLPLLQAQVNATLTARPLQAPGPKATLRLEAASCFKTLPVHSMPKSAESGLVRLPAFGCRSYHEGRCLYEEQLNPGLDVDLRCSVQLRWRLRQRAR